MRTKIGLIALVLLGGAAIRYLTTGDLADMLLGGLLRVGLVTGAVWLAWPQFTAMFAKTPKWLIVAIAVSFVVFCLRPQLLWWLPVGLVALWAGWFAWSRIGMGLLKKSSRPTTPPRRPKRKA